MNTKAIDILEEYKKKVWPEIDAYLKNPIFPKSFQISKEYNHLNKFHWEIIRDYPERKGKYIRPALLMLTAEALGVDLSKVTKIAAAMQLSEDWLLIFDDFQDKSLFRRGKPTLHRIYGSELAVNAGELLQTIMWKIIMDSSSSIGKEKCLLLANEFFLMLSRTILGQTVEVKWAKENKGSISDKEWFFIADGKTSYYTIAGPMRLAGIISGLKEDKLEKIATFGKYLGRCFQLIDDILDLTSEFNGLKKQKGNDLYEGKKTVILGHLLRNVSAEEKEKVLKILAKDVESKTQEEIEWIMKLIHKYESLEYARNLALEMKNKSLQIFEKDLAFLNKEPARKKLGTLFDFILEREI